jgi:hypothetical protein
MWPTLERAIHFVLAHQLPTGEIHWALDPKGKIDPMALLTGCSSICFSLKCAIRLARLLGIRKPFWLEAMKHLEQCITQKPFRFNMTKSRFAMDWYYPILGGAVRGQAAQARIDRYWKKFVVQNLGVRCVSDQPWVTIAETCELVLSLCAMDQLQPAQILFGWLGNRLYGDHTYWCGFTFPDMAVWPEEKITWTNAVVLLAADHLYGLTPAANLFRHRHWRHLK